MLRDITNTDALPRFLTHSLTQSGGENGPAEREGEARMDKQHFSKLVEEKSFASQPTEPYFT